MNTSLSTLSLGNRTLFCVKFEPHSFAQQDLFWLPHHAQLAKAVISRKAEHLAGRIAAVHALRHAGSLAAPPGIGAHREPLWPPGFTGSISHADGLALAVAKPAADRFTSLGIDYQPLLTDNDARQLADGVLFGDERAWLERQPLPFGTALSLVFSAKESLFKALFPAVQRRFGFECARIIACSAVCLALELTEPLGHVGAGARVDIVYTAYDGGVITLVDR